MGYFGELCDVLCIEGEEILPLEMAFVDVGSGKAVHWVEKVVVPMVAVVGRSLWQDLGSQSMGMAHCS